MKKKSNEGMALISVMIVGIGLMAIGTLIAARAVSEKNRADITVNLAKAQEAALSGLELASVTLWSDYLDNASTDDSGGETSGTLSEYFEYADGIELKNNEDVNGNGTEDEDEVDLNNDGQFSIAEPVTILENVVLENGSTVASVVVSRTDNSAGTDIIVKSTGTFAGISKTTTQAFRIGGEPFKGFEFGLLANNINCIMCHADFDSVYRRLNTDDGEAGTFDRIKVASLESLMVRVGKADSNIAGTYYTRGTIKTRTGQPLSDLAGSGVLGTVFDDDGNLVESSANGALTGAEMSVAGTDAETGFYEPLGQLYTDYPTEEEGMTDGELPAVFPPVIPDTNGNRLVDDSEFTHELGSGPLGSILGGIAYGLPEGETYLEPALPTASNTAMGSLSSSGRYDGNLFLIGTEANPIQLSGKIAVDGDLVIKGPIEGTGQLYAKNNIYFVGDTTYADSAGGYGETADGTTNLAAYAAGGNIMVGDYLTPKGVITLVETTKWKKKKKKWVTTEKSVTVDADVTTPEYLTDLLIDPGGPPNSGESSSFTMSEVTLFNKIEYQKAQADASHVARYYTLREGDPVYRFTGSKEHGDKYDENFTEFAPGAGDAVISLGPSGGWLPELFLKQAWRDDQDSRSAAGSPYRIDGLLYTNNSIMALARSFTKHKSLTYGEFIVRGGLIASDVGILAAGDKNAGNRGFTMLYDVRVSGFLAVHDVTNLEFSRGILFFRDMEDAIEY